MSRPRGFTVIEVLVAILILSVAVVSVFGAQFSAVASVEYVRASTSAVELARCRMSEVELEVQINGGFEEGDVAQSGDCCEQAASVGAAGDFTCRTQIDTIELPDLTSLAGGGDGGMLDAMGLDLFGDGDLSGGGGQTGAGGDTAALGMAQGLMPMVTEILRQAIRRVTVTVSWSQGFRDRELVVTQYLTHPTQGPLELLQQVNAFEEAQSQAEELTGGGGTGGGGTGGGKTGGRDGR